MIFYDNHLSAAENDRINLWLARQDRRDNDTLSIWRWFFG